MSLLLLTRLSVRERLLDSWNDTNFHFGELNSKGVYYLSIESLLGRTLGNSLLNIEMERNSGKALKQFSYDLEDLYNEEESMLDLEMEVRSSSTSLTWRFGSSCYLLFGFGGNQRLSCLGL